MCNSQRTNYYGVSTPASTTTAATQQTTAYWPAQPAVVNQPVQTLQPATQPVQTFQPAVQPVQTLQPATQPVQTFQPAVQQPVQTFQPAVQPVQTMPSAIVNPFDPFLPDNNPPTMGMIRPEGASIMPETLAEPIYTPGFLRTQIGKLMRVEFLIGSAITDRVGILSAVGASFIILTSLEQQTRIVCDLFSIKFVSIIEGAMAQALIAGI